MHRLIAVAILFAVTVVAQKPFELKVDGDDITLTIVEDGMAMADFVKLAEGITGRAFTFSAEVIAAADPVMLTGSVRMKKAAFLPFFQSMIYSKGLVAVARGEGDAAVIEIAAARAPAAPGSDARYVAAAELEGHRADPSMVLTSIALAHIAPQDAIDRLRPVLATTATKALLEKVGKSLLVQGAGTEVYRVARMVRLLDVPPMVVFEVVALQHAAPSELAKGLQALVVDRQPKAVVIAHDQARSMLISGPRAVVDELVELATLLDRPAKK